MGVIRSLVGSGSPRRHSVLLFGLLVMLIFGLLAMHVLSVSGSHGEHAPGSPVAALQVDHGAGGVLPSEHNADHTATQTAGESHCNRDCGALLPNHSMLMVGCVLALLAGAIVVLGPMLLGRSWVAVALAVRSVPVAGGVLRRPRPPSLVVLSISRT